MNEALDEADGVSGGWGSVVFCLQPERIARADSNRNSPNNLFNVVNPFELLLFGSLKGFGGRPVLLFEFVDEYFHDPTDLIPRLPPTVETVTAGVG